jgi:hypothetical protein
MFKEEEMLPRREVKLMLQPAVLEGFAPTTSN